MVINGGLAPLEFADCLLDSPDFRENLNRHEKELEKTSQQIKRIIKEIKELMQAAKSKQSRLIKYLNLHEFIYTYIFLSIHINNFFRSNHVMEFFYVFFFSSIHTYVYIRTVCI